MHNKHEYELYLQSDHWAALRRKAFPTHGDNCELCERLPRYPHVHHIRYLNLLDVTTDDLAVLYEKCHSKVHNHLSKHPKTLDSRYELLHWKDSTIKRRKGVRATPKSIRRKITRIKRAQKKRGNQYGKNKLANMKGFFFPAPNKPHERKQRFFSVLEDEYVPKDPNVSIIEKAVALSARNLSPVKNTQTQVDGRRKAPSIVKILA